jgi:hypothetical protein
MTLRQMMMHTDGFVTCAMALFHPKLCKTDWALVQQYIWGMLDPVMHCLS